MHFFAVSALGPATAELCAAENTNVPQVTARASRSKVYVFMGVRSRDHVTGADIPDSSAPAEKFFATSPPSAQVMMKSFAVRSG